VNLANTLTRRREPYHEGREREGEPTEVSSGTPSIHELEEGFSLSELPPEDRDERALFVDRILSGETTVEGLKEGRFEPLHSWAKATFELIGAEVGRSSGGKATDELTPAWIEVSLATSTGTGLRKGYRFEADGTVEAVFEWKAGAFPADAFFSTEISLGSEAEILATPKAEIWRFPISTYSKSERGLDETVQGESVTVLWPAAQGHGRVRISRG
jgi:hypothetical protein